MSLYFKNIPDLEYIFRGNDTLNRYVKVKNLFKRLKLRDDIFQNLVFFNKYEIVGDERPDNVAYKLYNDETLDWLVLICNNILNIQSEWPLAQKSYDNYLIEKYSPILGMEKNFDLINGTTVKGTQLNDVEEAIYSVIHHYETKEIRTVLNNIIVPAGLKVDKDYKISYYDPDLGDDVERSVNLITPITNYEFEDNLENKKRTIFVLKKRYLGLVLRDIEEQLPYKSGGTQFINKTLKRVDDIRITE
jgi:hypothetical protein